MPDCFYRVVQHHPRACPTHDFSHALTHFRLIAMHWTLLAGRLTASELTPIKTFFCVA